MTFQSEVLADSPIEFWKLDETSGSTAASAGSGAHSGTATGTTIVNGIDAKARSFNGSSDYISAASVADFTAQTNYTFEAWFKISSADTTGTDWRTIARRDGSGAWLVRVAGSTSGSTQGSVQAYLQGRTISTGATRFDDGNWHHVVITKGGSTTKLYVDKVEYTTASGTLGVAVGTSQPLYIGSNNGGTGEFFKGTIDDVAVYHTALSTTRLGAHYDSAFVAGGYTAQAMTASASMPNAGRPNAYVASPLTASAASVDPVVSQVSDVVASRDVIADGSSVASTGTSLNLNGSYYAVIDFELPADFTLAGMTGATLRLYQTGTGAIANVTVEPITAEWSDADVTHSVGTGLTVSMGFGPGYANIDVSSIMPTGAFYGFKVSSSNKTFASTESANDPILRLAYKDVQQAVTYDAQPMSASAEVVNPTTGITAAEAAEPFAVSASMPNPTVVGERFVTYAAEAMTAYADMSTDNHFALPVTIEADPLTADTAMTDVTLETATGVIWNAEPLGATVSWVKPALVNGAAIVLDEDEDAYFGRVFGLAPQVWQRLNDQGSTALDRMGTYNGVYHGVQVGKFDAPEGRHSVHFVQGSYLEQNEPAGNNADEAWIQDSIAEQSTLEFSFRTNNGNTFLMAGADSTQTTAGVKSSYAARELFLVGGKLTFRSRIFAGTPDQVDKEFSGFRNLADNKWHHVVVRSGVYSRGEWGVELWIDGTFEVRRFNANGFMGFPDFIGFRPNNIDGSELETLPLSQGFVGDMTEVVFYNHNHLASHDIARNYYAFMGWAPIYPAPFEAAAAMGDNKGKGSQKKALYLYFNALDEVFQTGDSVADSVSFDPMPGFVEKAYQAPNIPFTNYERVGDYHGFKVFSRSVQVDTRDQSYRDPVTDDPSLINLGTDIDLSEYDLIMFKDWPDEGKELDFINTNFPGQLERLQSQLMDFNSAGGGLNITNPRMANDLGIIGRYEFVPTLRENKYNKNQGNAYGLYDYGSALKFPWNISASDGLTGGEFATGIGQAQNLGDSFLENKAYFYHDTNKNDRFRVRALVEGLTDIPGWMLKDTVFHVDYDQYGWQGVAYKYLKADDGLTIGDEFIYNGSEEIPANFLNSTEKRYQRFNGTWATPVSEVKAGTIVTTFGAKHWLGKSEVDNPFKDYATTIVLGPGDSIKGRPVVGRIYVNFTEQPSYGLAAVSQVVPANDKLPLGYNPETTAQREWDYSWTRTTLLSTQGSSSVQSVTVILPDGSTSTFKTGDAEATTLSMVRSNQLFPLEARARMEMNSRGMYWLSQAEDIDPDAAVVRATPMEATAEIKQPTVIAQRQATVRAQAFNVTVDMPRVAEDTYGDVVIRPLPMTAEATFGGYTKNVYPAPMLADAELVELFDAVHAGGEQVALTLHNFEATLYLKEDA